MSTGHLTHSEDHVTAIISNDLSQHPHGTQYWVRYDTPHVTSGDSVNPMVDSERTKTYNADLKEILKES